VDRHRVTPAGCDDAGFNEAVRAVLGRIHDSCSVAAGRPMSVVDMGLVLGWRLGADGVLAVEFCVTWGGCTMAPHFMGAAERDLAGLPGVAQVVTRIDHDHVWDERAMRTESDKGSIPIAFRQIDSPTPNRTFTDMAGGLKKRRKRTIEGTATMDGIAMTWELTSEPQWSNSGDGYKGMCISVHVANEARRELIIEYPYPTNGDGRPLPVPQRPTITPKIVEASIGEALAAGWDPSSRGKAFVFYPPAQAK